ncbi:shikimate kinase AroK [Vogesella oryzae]|uniref:shikimate kinase AroK n=1 Tax=Vogesella oryzae TaxID=1735285 RepID=UPI0015844519|nr:shikimate kinase AroK [Vogesella oryzae]
MPAMELAGNFFLVGLMGAGKTTVGRTLARHTGKTFYDSDHEIERRTGVKIATIFDIEGEASFRAREKQVIAELCQMQNIVLATGGGAILAPENRQMLSAYGTVIYLRAQIDDILARTKHDKSRPLLRTSDPRAKLEQLYQQRDPLYMEIADVVMDTSCQNVNTLVQRLEQRLLTQLP